MPGLTVEQIRAAVADLKADAKEGDITVELGPVALALHDLMIELGLEHLEAGDLAAAAVQLRARNLARARPAPAFVPCVVSVVYERTTHEEPAANILGEDGSVDDVALNDLVKNILRREGAFDDLDCGDEPITGTINGAGLLLEFDVEPELVFDCVVRDGGG